MVAINHRTHRHPEQANGRAARPKARMDDVAGVPLTAARSGDRAGAPEPAVQASTCRLYELAGDGGAVAPSGRRRWLGRWPRGVAPDGRGSRLGVIAPRPTSTARDLCGHPTSTTPPAQLLRSWPRVLTDGPGAVSGARGGVCGCGLLKDERPGWATSVAVLGPGVAPARRSAGCRCAQWEEDGGAISAGTCIGLEYPSIRPRAGQIGRRRGVVERDCQDRWVGFGQRLKGEGMRWGEEGAQPVTYGACCKQLEKGQWGAFWNASTPSQSSVQQIK